MRGRRWAWILVALLIGACGGPSVVDMASLEDEVIQSAAEGGLTVTSVECPEERAVEQGDTFSCRATLDSGEVITVQATQADADGSIALEQVEAVIDGATFAGAQSARVSADYGLIITLQCPARIVIIDGGTVACQGTDDQGDTRTVTFTARDAQQGDFSYVVDGLEPPP